MLMWQQETRVSREVFAKGRVFFHLQIRTGSFSPLSPLSPRRPLQTTSSALKGAIQLGITHTVGSLSTKPERDVLMQDFYVVESIFFPR